MNEFEVRKKYATHDGDSSTGFQFEKKIYRNRNWEKKIKCSNLKFWNNYIYVGNRKIY